MLKLICSLSASSVLLLASFAATGSPITITSSNIIAQANNGIGGAASDTDTSTAFGSRSLLAVDGATSAGVDLNWIDTTAGALLDFDMNQTREGAYNASATAKEFGLKFMVDTNTTYSLSGQYSVTGIASAGYAASMVYLYNLTTSTMIFKDFNESFSTLNENFIVGVGGEGDAINDFLGSATGNLFAGNQYQLWFSNRTQAHPSADGGASATGCVTLAIGGATGAGSCGSSSVPEPMPLTLLGAGLAALGLRRRLRVKVA